jgi:hypothetical protein
MIETAVEYGPDIAKLAEILNCGCDECDALDAKSRKN